MNHLLSLRRAVKQNLALLAAGLSLAALIPSVHAAAQTWNDAGADDIWSTTAPNWLGGVPWTNGNNAVFNAVSGETVEVNGTVAAAGLTSNFSALTLSTGYNIVDANSDGLLDLSATGGGGTTSKPIIAATGTNTIGVNILISGSAGSTGGRVISLGAGASLTISGNISESDQPKFLSIANGGTLTLSGSNSHTGGTTIANQATALNVSNAYALGTGSLRVGAQTFVLNNTSGSAIVLATNNDIILAGTTLPAGSASVSNVSFSGSSNLSFGSGIVMMADRDRSIGVSAGILSVGGISEDSSPRSFFKNGGGTLEVTGITSYTGNTTISAGTMLLTSASESRFVIQDGTISNRFLGSGTVSFDGDFRLDITGLTDSSGTWNLVSVATLNESFGSNFGLAFTTGPVFTNNLDGTYTSGGWTFDTATGNLTLVPEPSTVMLLGIGFMLVLARIRRAAWL